MTRIVDLTAITSISDDGLFIVVEQGATRKLTAGNLKANVKGFTGSAGVGYTGSFGPVGYAGSRGVVGYAGSVGDLGYTGSASTASGYVGSAGFTGSIGIGYTGSPGFVGSRGFTGSVGYAGSLGYAGSIGFVGSQGYAGSAGITVAFVPAHSTSTGVVGQIAYDSTYVYFCVATNTWVKSLATVSW